MFRGGAIVDEIAQRDFAGKRKAGDGRQEKAQQGTLEVVAVSVHVAS